MAMITESYRELNRQLHESNPHYGTTAAKYISAVKGFAESVGAGTILDYGCGKGRLQRGLIRQIAEYDPCIAGKDHPPNPADLVVSIDVMEHIEPDCLDDVLDDIQRLALKAVFLTIATRPAVKVLADGRNAHLIVQPLSWWLPKLDRRWDLMAVQATADEIVFAGTARQQRMEAAA